MESSQNTLIFCPTCNKEVSYYVKREIETYPVKNDQISIMASIACCENCDEKLWNAELDSNNLKSAYRVYRSNHKLLQPEEIREIREKYEISQTVFARILGFGDKTITRYENGSIQDEAQNNLIWLMANPIVFKMMLNKNLKAITNNEYQKLCKIINKLNAVSQKQERLCVGYNRQASVYSLDMTKEW